MTCPEVLFNNKNLGGMGPKFTLGTSLPVTNLECRHCMVFWEGGTID